MIYQNSNAKLPELDSVDKLLISMKSFDNNANNASIRSNVEIMRVIDNNLKSDDMIEEQDSHDSTPRNSSTTN